MKNRWQKKSLQQTMMYGFGALFSVSLLAFLLFFLRSYQEELQTEIERMEEYNEQLTINLDSILNSTESFLYLHFSDDKIRNLLCSDDSDIDAESQKATENNLEEYLKLLVDMENDVLRAVIVTRDGRIYKSVEEIEDDYIERMSYLIKDVQWEKDTPGYFSPVHKETISLVEHKVVSVIRPVWNIVDEEPIATIYLDLDFDKLSNQWYRSAKMNQSFEFFILGEGELLFDSQKGELSQTETMEELTQKSKTLVQMQEKQGLLKLHGKQCVASAVKHEDTGWYLVQYLSVWGLVLQILDNMSVLLVVLIGVVLITAAGSYALAKWVSHPVKELSDFMGNVADISEEGQEIAFFPREQVEGTEEIQQMIESYNAMAKRINDNIIKDYIYKLNQKQAELKMLQFQINPHFLYNALNTISSIAQLQDVDYIPEIASGLSDMFRYNIDGREIVSIREEITQTENYMCIQKIRFPERFSVEISVEEELFDCKVLKFILQPIVENSYKYGFTEKKKKDILRIRGYREAEETIILIVEDNGVGMEEEKVQAINEALAREAGFEAAAGIGLRNVNARIKNYYGEPCGIWLESCLGEYTRVYLRVKSMDVSQEKRG